MTQPGISPEGQQIDGTKYIAALKNTTARQIANLIDELARTEAILGTALEEIEALKEFIAVNISVPSDEQVIEGEPKP